MWKSANAHKKSVISPLKHFQDISNMWSMLNTCMLFMYPKKQFWFKKKNMITYESAWATRSRQSNATQELIPVKLVNTQPWLLCSTVLFLRPRKLSGKTAGGHLILHFLLMYKPLFLEAENDKSILHHFSKLHIFAAGTSIKQDNEYWSTVYASQ